MKLYSFKTLQDFTHNLLFPAILGSMIFELLNVGPDSSSRYPVFTFFQICIVCFYIVDYLFINGEFVKKDKYLVKRWMYFFDIAIVVLYRVAFSIVKYENYSGVILSIAAILILIYIYVRQQFRNTIYLLFLAILGVIASIISLTIYKGYPNIINAYFLGIIFLAYFIYVFFIHAKYAKPKEKNN